MISNVIRKLRFHELKLSTKIILTYLLLTIIPLTVIGYLSHTKSVHSIEKPIAEFMPHFLQMANNEIEQHLIDRSDISEMLTDSEVILEILRPSGENNKNSLARDTDTFNRYLNQTYVNGSHSDVLGVYVLSNEQLYYSSKWVFQEQDWKWQLRRYGGLESAQGKARLIRQDEIKLHYANKVPYVMFKKQMYDSDNRKPLGVMFVAIDLSFMDEIFRNLESGGKGQAWLMTETGKILYHTNRNKIGEDDSRKSSYPILNGSFRFHAAEGSEVISLNQSSMGLILAHSMPTASLTDEVTGARVIHTVLFVCIVLLTSFFFLYFTWRFIQPIKKLSSMMKNVELGKFQVNYELQSRDEIGTLAKSLNSMIVTVRDLIQKNYQIEIRQKEAELYALQSQINPHFMYNTLETIGMAVEEGETEAVVDMVTLLGRMLRFSVSNLSRSVTIAEEVQHIKDYLTIQKFRFEDRLSFDIMSPKNEEILKLYSPKFILQPVVENAIKHGLEKRRMLEVQITIGQEFGAQSGNVDVVFRIRDNGPGITADRLAEIESLLASQLFEHKSSQFGLSNVNARIKMMHGTEYGLQLHSIEGLGTEVIIRIPMNSNAYESVNYEISG